MPVVAIHFEWAMNSELSIDKSEKTEDFQSATFMWACMRVFLLSYNHSACTVNKWMTIETFFEILHRRTTKKCSKKLRKTEKENTALRHQRQLCWIATVNQFIDGIIQWFKQQRTKTTIEIIQKWHLIDWLISFKDKMCCKTKQIENNTNKHTKCKLALEFGAQFSAYFKIVSSVSLHHLLYN